VNDTTFDIVTIRQPVSPRPKSSGQLEDLDVAAARFAREWTVAATNRRRELRADLVCHCLPFARRMAVRYRGRGEPFEDLEQVARLGLINAIDRYDPDRGSFTAFAVITIRGELKRYFRDKTWALHVDRRVQDLALELQHATVLLTNTLQRDPDIAELAKYLDVSEDEIQQARLCRACYTPVPLSTPIGADGSLELRDTVGGPDDALEAVTDNVTVAELIRLLPDRIQRMLAMRFHGNLTQVQIAAEFGVSQMHVSRLLARATQWLRAAMLSDVPPPWAPAADYSNPGNTSAKPKPP
jgi:RNA polymerase sigma-B factor